MSPAAVRISSAVPFAAPVSANPSDQQRRRVEVRRQRGQRSSRRRPPGSRRRSPAGARSGPSAARPASAASARGDEEDRRPEPEQPGDAGDEHERDRRHRRDELQHATSRPPSPPRAAACCGGSGSVGQAPSSVRPRPRWRSAGTRALGGDQQHARRVERSAGSAASGAAPDSPIASPASASSRIAACVSASETVIVPRMPAQQRRPGGLARRSRSRGRPSSCPASGSRPARPRCSAAVRQAAVVRLDADHGRARPPPRSAPPRRASEPTPTGTRITSHAPRARRTASRSRRSPTRAGPGRADVGELEARPAARPRPPRARRRSS